MNANLSGAHQQFDNQVQEFVSDDDQFNDDGECEATESDPEQEGEQ